MNTQKYYYVIEENIKNSKMFELKTFTSGDKYIRFNQNSLRNYMEKKTFKKLLKNGLFMKKKERPENTQVSLQRLVGCLYDNITGFDMHHIDKNKADNSILNLVPLPSDINKSIDSLPREKMIKIGKEAQANWKEKIEKKERETLSKNLLLVLSILSDSIGKKAVEVQKKFKKKIKSIKTMRNILNTFYYAEEFLNYLKIKKINILGN